MFLKFRYKEWFSLLCIPIVFLVNFFFIKFTYSPNTIGVMDTSIRIILFIIIFLLFKDYLIKEWSKFKNLKFYKWLIIIFGAIILQVIISVTSNFFPTIHSDGITNNPSENIDFLNISAKMYFLLFFFSFGPVVTSLIEDLIFRYTLLEKLLRNNILFNFILVLINSFLFGAIHYSNFGGNLINTIPYMFAGLFLNCIYLWTRNIWHVLLIHFLNNFVLTTAGIIIFGLIRIIMSL